ncbi:MAG: hypothetical protein R2881_07535 [Eubacteriales bacterium]
MFMMLNPAERFYANAAGTSDAQNSATIKQEKRAVKQDFEYADRVSQITKSAFLPPLFFFSPGNPANCTANLLRCTEFCGDFLFSVTICQFEQEMLLIFRDDVVHVSHVALRNSACSAAKDTLVLSYRLFLQNCFNRLSK